MNGLDVLSQIRDASPSAAVVIMTAYGSLETVTRAIRDQAFDYLVKPLDLDQAEELVKQAAAARAAMAALTGGADETVESAAEPRMIGASPAMQEVYKSIAKAAPSEATILVLGDTGTGKEMVARAIHEHSSRRDKPFVAVNCGALPESLVESELFGYVRGAFTGADADRQGRFEAANGGTLLLDEIGDLPAAAQVKLLRFLDSHTIERLGSVKAVELDIRIVAATNRDLSQAIAEGRFRDDLFYRLAVIQVHLPPLADRAEDVVPLARYFLAQSSPPGQPLPPISQDAVDLLTCYAWPGNVRELRNAIEHARTLSGTGPLLPGHLPEAVRKGAASQAGVPGKAGDNLAQEYVAAMDLPNGRRHDAAIEPVERALIRRALAETGGNQSLAAELLGVHRNTLRNKIRQYGLGPDSA
jgi:DNA-binding NtrC family response regulator